MQTKLRTKIATAALMLVPVAALVAAQPAAAQQRFDDHRHEQDRDHRGDHDFRRDRRAPEVFAVTPSGRVNARGLTTVSARYRDDASGIDLRSVTLRIDGRNVSRHARVDGNDVRYVADLQRGRHFAELFVRDRAGNVTRKAWDFAVVGRG